MPHLPVATKRPQEFNVRATVGLKTQFLSPHKSQAIIRPPSTEELHSSPISNYTPNNGERCGSRREGERERGRELQLQMEEVLRAPLDRKTTGKLVQL